MDEKRRTNVEKAVIVTIQAGACADHSLAVLNTLISPNANTSHHVLINVRASLRTAIGTGGTARASSREH